MYVEALAQFDEAARGTLFFLPQREGYGANVALASFCQLDCEASAFVCAARIFEGDGDFGLVEIYLREKLFVRLGRTCLQVIL